tara:strand:- start:428 stop:1459 length:1032 start_codon:yes stop_codon:yes gene_type:complete
MKLHLVDLEPIEKRYTKQWQEWIPTLVKKYGGKKFEVETISGKSDGEIKSGQFLDINRTQTYKSEQIIEIANLFEEGKVSDGDVFLFYDGWHYGIQALRYMSQCQDINVKIYAIWHAGTYDEWDLLAQKGLGYWGANFERSLFEATDGIFSSTEFHKQLISSTRNVPNEKIHVTGYPFSHDWLKDYDTSKKENIVVFPHRTAPEKRHDIFLEVAKKMKNSDIEFITTTDVTETKDDYYKLLAKSKVSWSGGLQETCGISTFESLWLGNIVMVPNRLSYKEMYFDMFKYEPHLDSDVDVQCEMIQFAIEHYDEYIEPIKENAEKLKDEQGPTAVQRMLKIISEA